MLEKIEGRRRRGQQWMRQLDDITDLHGALVAFSWSRWTSHEKENTSLNGFPSGHVWMRELDYKES